MPVCLAVASEQRSHGRGGGAPGGEERFQLTPRLVLVRHALRVQSYYRWALSRGKHLLSSGNSPATCRCEEPDGRDNRSRMYVHKCLDVGIYHNCSDI